MDKSLEKPQRGLGFFSIIKSLPECGIKEMMLITWSASWCERSRPTQRKRPGDFCTTAWSNKGDKLRLVLGAIFAKLLASTFAVTKHCEREDRVQKGFQCYLWYSKPCLCESCMNTVSVGEQQSRAPFLFHAVDVRLFSGYTLGWT